MINLFLFRSNKIKQPDFSLKNYEKSSVFANELVANKDKTRIDKIFFILGPILLFNSNIIALAGSFTIIFG